MWISHCENLKVAFWDIVNIKFVHILGQFFNDWRTMMHWNIVLTIFNKLNVCHNAMKTVKTTLHCVVFLQSRVEGHTKLNNKKKNYLTNLCLFSFSFGTFSQRLENYETSKCSSDTFHACGQKCCVWIIVHHCALLYSNFGETVLEDSWTRTWECNINIKRRENI